MRIPEPIVLTVDLAATPAEAYSVFTARFSDWWPITTHSLSRDAMACCRLEARPGGAVDEVLPDGTRHVWGEVLAVEPGRRIRFSWHPGREPESAQWILVEFEPASAGSRVTLTHGGWETLGEIAPLLRQEYVPGWRHVLGTLFAGFLRALR
ncbi:MAG: SRPBCC domain-containing protein [Steroidobacteraceae bacterium]